MTTEPKFIPKTAALIELSDGVSARFRLVDSVGFMVDGAVGHEENGEVRMVKTPWFHHEIPFTEAAQIGTEKVIRDHSTIGVMVTTDGSIGALEHDQYLIAEEQTVKELKKIGKPFLILLNSIRPYSEEVKAIAADMEKRYGVSVMPMNCEQMKREDAVLVLKTVLREFPISRIDVRIPGWMEMLENQHPLKQIVIKFVKQLLDNCNRMKDLSIDAITEKTGEQKFSVGSLKQNMDTGVAELDIRIDENIYYQILSEQTGVPVRDEFELFEILAQMSELQGEYEKVRHAMQAVRAKGYGIVMPDKSEIILKEPELIKHGNKYGVKIHAQAPSINLIKAHVETEIAPIVGNEQQAKDLISYIKRNESTEQGVWETNIFGKSVEQIVEDGMQAKISQMTDDCQSKLQDTLQKIINDSNGGMICIII